MSTIQSIQDVLKTYAQAYGAEALQSQLTLFMKSLPSSAAPLKASPAPSSAAESSLSKLKSQELRDIWAELTGRKAGIKSSGKFSKKEDLIAEIERLRASPASEEAPSEPKEKKRRSGPSAWNAFVEAVSGKGKIETAEFSAWKAEQPEGQKGNLRFTFASSLGKTAFEEFKSTWTPSSSSSVSSAEDSSDDRSVASSSVSETKSEKKARGRPKMTEEQKAERDAAKKAAKDEAKALKKAAKKAEKAAKKTALPPLPESEDEDDEESSRVYTEVSVGDVNYFWDERTNQLYDREEDGSYTQIGSFDGQSMHFF